MPERIVTSEGGKFAIVPIWVVMTAEPQALRLYALLAGRYADQDGVAYPSRKRLADELGVVVRTVDAGVQNLERIGALIVTRRPALNERDHDTNLYRVQRIAPPGAADFATLEQPAALPLVQSAAPEPDPLEPDPLNHKRPAHLPVDETYLEMMVQRFDGKLSADQVQDEIDRALNHPASKRWVDKRMGVLNWLKKAVEFKTERTSNTLSRERAVVSTNPGDYANGF